MYDEVDGAFDEMIGENNGRKISGVGPIGGGDIEELRKTQNEKLKDEIAEFAYRKSSSNNKQISILTATIAGLFYEVVSSSNESEFFEKYKGLMGKNTVKLKTDNTLEKQLEDWLIRQPLPVKNGDQIELARFQACMLSNTLMAPKVTVIRPNGEMLTLGLYEIIKNLKEADLDWNS